MNPPGDKPLDAMMGKPAAVLTLTSGGEVVRLSGDRLRGPAEGVYACVTIDNATDAYYEVALSAGDTPGPCVSLLGGEQFAPPSIVIGPRLSVRLRRVFFPPGSSVDIFADRETDAARRFQSIHRIAGPISDLGGVVPWFGCLGAADYIANLPVPMELASKLWRRLSALIHREPVFGFAALPETADEAERLAMLLQQNAEARADFLEAAKAVDPSVDTRAMEQAIQGISPESFAIGAMAFAAAPDAALPPQGNASAKCEVADYVEAASVFPEWIPGDGHIHSCYSAWDLAYLVDLIGLKPPSVRDQAVAAKANELRWVIITDHDIILGHPEPPSLSGVLKLSPPGTGSRSWKEMAADCAQASQKLRMMVIPGQESGGCVPKYLGIGPSQLPYFDDCHGHYLCYGIHDFVGSDDSCRDMINKTKAVSGLGFIAHPGDTQRIGKNPVTGEEVTVVGLRWEDWSASAYTGVEIITFGKVDSYAKRGGKWDQHLTGELNTRAGGGVPDTTHIAVAGSDAHWPGQPGHEDIFPGKSVTWLYVPDPSVPDAVFQALREGRCVVGQPMTDKKGRWMGQAPLIFFALNDGMIGDTVKVKSGETAMLAIQWKSPSPIARIWIIGKPGVVLGEISQAEAKAESVGDGLFRSSSPISVKLSFTEPGYVRLVAETSAKNRAFTNPIWVLVE